MAGPLTFADRTWDLTSPLTEGMAWRLGGWREENKGEEEEEEEEEEREREESGEWRRKACLKER